MIPSSFSATYVLCGASLIMLLIIYKEEKKTIACGGFLLFPGLRDSCAAFCWI